MKVQQMTCGDVRNWDTTSLISDTKRQGQIGASTGESRSLPLVLALPEEKSRRAVVRYEVLRTSVVRTREMMSAYPVSSPYYLMPSVVDSRERRHH